MARRHECCLCSPFHHLATFVRPLYKWDSIPRRGRAYRLDLNAECRRRRFNNLSPSHALAQRCNPVDLTGPHLALVPTLQPPHTWDALPQHSSEAQVWV